MFGLTDQYVNMRLDHLNGVQKGKKFWQPKKIGGKGLEIVGLIIFVASLKTLL